MAQVGHDDLQTTWKQYDTRLIVEDVAVNAGNHESRRVSAPTIVDQNWDQ